MTVHVHKTITCIAAGGSQITPEANGIAELETPRTWAFDAPPAVEQRVLDDIEWTSRAADTVPNTVDENIAEQNANRHAAKDVQDMASALRELVNERRAS
jgi:hypothetical protein